MARHHRPRVTPADRTAIVFGAGGILGAAWMAGAVTALQEQLPYPIGSVGTVVGTSAGSVLAAALRCGVSVEGIVAHQRGSVPSELPQVNELDREAGGPLPHIPRIRPGSPRLVLNTVRAPLRMHPWVAASAFVPQGRAQHRSLEALVRGMVEQHAAGVAPDWPDEGETWIVAVDYDTGQRVAFGRAGAPPAALPDAVVASCSIPGWYEPKVIDGRRYVDGGVRSSTSLGLLAGQQLDQVYVLAPMASLVADNPRHPYARLERAFRRVVTAALEAEARRIETTGARVTMITPGPDDLRAIGVNLMDPRRREQVLDTSLRTSPATIAAQLNRRDAA